MADIDFLLIGLGVTAFVVIANLLIFIGIPMTPIFVKKLKEPKTPSPAAAPLLRQ